MFFCCHPFNLYQLTWSDPHLLPQRQRYSIIDRKRLYELTEIGSWEQFRSAQTKWIEEALRAEKPDPKKMWTKSVAVGNQSFVDAVKTELGFRARGRRTKKQEQGWVLREEVYAYMPSFEAENGVIGHKSDDFSNEIAINTGC